MKTAELGSNKTVKKPVPMTLFVLGSWWSAERSTTCSWGDSTASCCSRWTTCRLRWLRRASSLRVSRGLFVQHWLNVAEQRGEKLGHSLVAWQGEEYIRTAPCLYLCVCVCTAAVPGKMLMSMTVRVCVCMLMMTSTPNRAMPSWTLSSLTRAAMASELGGGRKGICSSSLQNRRAKEIFRVDFNPVRWQIGGGLPANWDLTVEAMCAPYMMPRCLFKQFCRYIGTWVRMSYATKVRKSGTS